MDIYSFTSSIGLAILAGFCIGMERQLTGHNAGIHTNVLVALGSCLFVLFSLMVGGGDPTRIAAQVVSGVGFLCSGIIFKEGLNVKGLKTAATLWCSAAMGVLSSLGMPQYVVVAVILVITSNVLFPLIGKNITPLKPIDDEEHMYLVSITCDEREEFSIRQTIINSIKTSRLRLIDLDSSDHASSRVEIVAKLQVFGNKREDLIERIVAKVALEKGIMKVGWHREE